MSSRESSLNFKSSKEVSRGKGNILGKSRIFHPFLGNSLLWLREELRPYQHGCTFPTTNFPNVSWLSKRPSSSDKIKLGWLANCYIAGFLIQTLCACTLHLNQSQFWWPGILAFSTSTSKRSSRFLASDSSVSYFLIQTLIQGWPSFCHPLETSTAVANRTWIPTCPTGNPFPHTPVSATHHSWAQLPHKLCRRSQQANTWRFQIERGTRDNTFLDTSLEFILTSTWSLILSHRTRSTLPFHHYYPQYQLKKTKRAIPSTIKFKRLIPPWHWYAATHKHYPPRLLVSRTANTASGTESHY